MDDERKCGEGIRVEGEGAQRALYVHVQCTYIVRTVGTMYVQCTYIVRTVPAGGGGGGGGGW